LLQKPIGVERLVCRWCDLSRAVRAKTAMASPMLEFRTPGYNPYAVQYSPYYDSRVAVAASANYGIVGNGRVFVLGMSPAGIQREKRYVYTTI
jgi:hypothetical protein